MDLVQAGLHHTHLHPAHNTTVISSTYPGLSSINGMGFGHANKKAICDKIHTSK